MVNKARRSGGGGDPRSLEFRVRLSRLGDGKAVGAAKMTYRTFFIIGWLTAMFMLIQILPVSRLVVNPHEVNIDGTKVAVHRTFPGDALGLKRPRLSFVETVRPLTQSHNDGQSCQEKGGPFRYDRADEIGRWDIGEWATPCLDDPDGYRWSACWTWHLGVLELGPACLSRTFLNGTR